MGDRGKMWQYFGKIQHSRMQWAQFEFPKYRKCCVSFTYGEFSFPIFYLCPFFPSSLSGVIRIGLFSEDGQKGGQFSWQSQLNRLQTVQFECPNVRNPSLLITFDIFLSFPLYRSFAPRFPVCSLAALSRSLHPILNLPYATLHPASGNLS